MRLPPSLFHFLRSYFASTAAALPHSSPPTTIPTAPQTYLRPRPRLSTSGRTASLHRERCHETLSLIAVSLHSHETERAEIMLQRLHNSYPQFYKDEISIATHNAFIRAFVSMPERARLDKALKWFGELAHYGVAPNSTTYSLMIKGNNGALRELNQDYVALVLEEMSRANISPAVFLGHPDLSTKELRRLERVMKAQGRPIPEEFKALHDRKRLDHFGETERDDIVDKALTTNSGLLQVTSPGMGYLRRSLASLSEDNPDLYAAQEKLELDAYQLALDQLQDENETIREQTGVGKINSVKGLLREWHEAMVQKCKEEIEKINTGDLSKANLFNICGCTELTYRVGEEREVYGPYFKLLEPEKLAILTIFETLKGHTMCDAAKSAGVKSARLLLGIGTALEYEYMNTFNRRVKYNTPAERAKAALEERKTEKLYREGNITVRWPVSAKLKVAAVLMKILMDNSYLVDPVTKLQTPFIRHDYEYVKGHCIGVFIYDSAFGERLAKQDLSTVMNPRFLPMMVPARPWLTWTTGGYLTQRSPCVRLRPGDNAYAKELLARADTNGDMADILMGLDVLGSTAWRINQVAYNAIKYAWNTTEAYEGIPRLISSPIPEVELTEDPEINKQRRSERKRAQIERANAHSMRCDVNYKLEIANSFMDRTMYFPHDMDFRGRAYPIPTHLNHLGNDLCRSLLIFDEAKPLGERGFHWLKVHIAGLYGFDKATFDERSAFTTEHMDLILDSANKPFDGKQWWLKGDKPWQLLSACVEMRNALQSDDPFTYESRLPIHMDGSCNGLQHYAALGKDIVGAQAVNLYPSDKPADVYNRVALSVLAMATKDEADGNPLATKLIPFIDRKLVKPTVMTSVYGVTYIGAKNQVTKRLLEAGAKEDAEVATYGTRLIFKALDDVFASARAIQNWLHETAGLIARSVDQVELAPMRKAGKQKSPIARTCPVIWTTPLGLPIVQPYRMQYSTTIKTSLQSISLLASDRYNPINARRQKAGFPPNFVHSLDSTHMLMTAVAAHRSGIIFASVHDSFWTHACDVDKLNVCLREQFVELHRKPILENLRAELVERYQSNMLPIKNTKKVIMPETISAEDIEQDLSDPIEQGEIDDMNGDHHNEIEEEMAEDSEPKVAPKGYKALKIPELPQRGDFDIENVLDSRYFFS